MDKKIIVIGNFKWDFYEKALVEGLAKNDIRVGKYIIKYHSLKYKIFNFKKLVEINKKFENDILKQQPDAIFCYRTNEIFPATLNLLKKKLPKLKILMFHNDNPYFGLKNKLKYFLFLSCIKEADITYVYRPSNINDAKTYRAKKVKLLYPYYYSKIHLNTSVNFENKKNDIIFIGHFEKNRAEFINELIIRNLNIKVFGPGWERVAKSLKWPAKAINESVYNNEYQETIANSKITLCFLSKINNDVYTRRNFEIPVSGSLVLSEYTKELEQMFIPDEEIVMFSDKNEFIEKINKILGDKIYLRNVTIAGQRRVIKDDHSEAGRAKQIIDDLIALQ